MRDDAALSPGRTCTDLDALKTELDEEITEPDPPQRAPAARPAAPLHPAPPGHPGPAPPQNHRPHRRQDLHGPGRQTVPALDVPHPHLPQLRARPRGRHPRRPGHLRLHRRPPATRCTSQRCSTGSSRTCAVSSATTSSTSPPSSHNGGLAPHIHIAFRGTISRADLRRVLAPPTTRSGGRARPPSGTRTTSCPSGMSRPAPTSTRPPAKSCPTWDDALDAIGDSDEPLHVARFGERFDAQGVLAGSKDAARCIGYLTKYLTKQVADCHQAAHRYPAGACRAAGRGTAVRAVLAAVRQLAPLRHPAQKRPARPASRAPARAKPTGTNTSATPDAGSSSLANGPARPSPTTGPTAAPGSWPPSARPPPTPPATPGSPSPPATPTTWNTPGASCTSSPTASTGTPP